MLHIVKVISTKFTIVHKFRSKSSQMLKVDNSWNQWEIIAVK